jgi:NADH dehydrogenase [ubiquinone] 1 alpha subcomplex assembly factor 1
LLFDFSAPESVASWHPVNDNVMGGVSTSRFSHDPAGYAVFSGHVSFENNGGFASVRCDPQELGSKGAVAYLLEVQGDGKRYKLNLRTDNRFDGVNYQAWFQPPAGEWVSIRLALTAFQPSWRGRMVPDAPPLDPAEVRQVGLMIADRQEGPFALAVRAITVEMN